MNTTYSSVDKSLPTKTTTAAEPLTAALSSTVRRAPLTKAYSCSDAFRPSVLSDCQFITPQQFVELVSQDSDALDHSSVPILDCRSHIDFGCERIRSSHNINCRAKIMARKLASKRLEEVEPGLCSSLNSCANVILYDQSSDGRTEDNMRSLPINLVIQAAQKSNKKVHIIQGTPAVERGCPPASLSLSVGGIDAVKNEYPHLIESPNELMKETCGESDGPAPPSSPDAVDKENFVMSEILPHIFVGTRIVRRELTAVEIESSCHHGVTSQTHFNRRS